MNKNAYVEKVCGSIDNKRTRKFVETELQDHIEAIKNEIMEKENISVDEAEQKAILRMGEADVLLNQYRDIYLISHHASTRTLLFTILALIGACFLAFSLPPFSFFGLTQVRSIPTETGGTTSILASDAVGGIIFLVVLFLTIVCAVMVPVSMKLGKKRMSALLNELSI